MRKEIENVAEDLDGFEDLDPADQEKVMAAFALGHVREQDMTPALREKDDNSEIGEEKQKPTQANKKRRRVSGNDEEVEYESGVDDDDAQPPAFIEHLPAKRQRKRTQRYGAPQTQTKTEQRDSDSDEAESGDENSDEDESEDLDSDEEDSDVFEDDEDDDDAEDDEDD